MYCLECGKVIPRGRKLSHTCSYVCKRKRKMRLALSLKKRKERTMKKEPKLTEKIVEEFSAAINIIFGDEESG